LSENNGF